MREDLKSAIVAVTALELDSEEKLNEREKLKQTLAALESDKKTAETLLGLPEASFTRLFERASAKGKRQGRVEGIVVGLITGIVSSWLVWYLTRDAEVTHPAPQILRELVEPVAHRDAPASSGESADVVLEVLERARRPAQLALAERESQKDALIDRRHPALLLIDLKLEPLGEIAP